MRSLAVPFPPADSCRFVAPASRRLRTAAAPTACASTRNASSHPCRHSPVAPRPFRRPCTRCTATSSIPTKAPSTTWRSIPNIRQVPDTAKVSTEMSAGGVPTNTYTRPAPLPPLHPIFQLILATTIYHLDIKIRVRGGRRRATICRSKDTSPRSAQIPRARTTRPRETPRAFRPSRSTPSTSRRRRAIRTCRVDRCHQTDRSRRCKYRGSSTTRGRARWRTRTGRNGLRLTATC